MEQFLWDRFETRLKRLQADILLVEDLLNKGKTGEPIPEEDIVKIRFSLTQAIEHIKGEIENGINRNDAAKVERLNAALVSQLKAEELVIELQTILHISSGSLGACQNPTTTSVKLPKLELLKFNGDILKWTEFWDQFEANVHNQNLKDVEKLAYFLNAMEGAAREILDGLGVTNDNYNVAIETMKARYGNRTKVIDSHYEALNKIQKCAHTPEDCRRNLNLVDRHLRILATMGEDSESNHLRSVILEKFPPRILYEVNLMTSGDRSVSSIRKTLDVVITAMEEAGSNRGSVPITTPHSSTEALHTVARKITYRKGKQIKPGRGYANPSAPNIINRKRKAMNINSPKPKRDRRTCLFCGGAHYNDECSVVTDHYERKKKLKNRCFKCLQSGHRVNACTYRKKCCYCKGDHNRALCPTKKKQSGTISVAQVTVSTMGRCDKAKSFLQIATAQILYKDKSAQCRILLDSGSQRSYITTGLAKHLDLTPISEELLMIYTFGSNKPSETLSPCSDITIRTKRGIVRKLHVNFIPHITNRLPSPTIPKGLVDVLADDESPHQGIDILIGNNYYFSFIRNNTVQIDQNLFLVDTDFGWIISGHTDKGDPYEEDTLTVVTYHQNSNECSCYTKPDLPLKNSDIKFLWSLENIGITDPVKATREEEAVQHFNETVDYHNGRYLVKWPWTTYPPDLPTNYGLAYGRLKGLLQRLDKCTIQEYDDILKEQRDANIIEEVDAGSDLIKQSSPPIHYLPHHIVKQTGKRGRIVYDASARGRDQKSLNECMYAGPCMLQDLTALLLNFRLYRYGVVADVEKAFLQVGLQEDDREVTRFLWLKDITKPMSNDNIKHFRFCRVPFGIISSPFLLTATIHNHISKSGNPLLKSMVSKFYVDNLVTGANTTHEALTLFHEATDTFKELSMNLRDWSSNNNLFVQEIPEQYKSKEMGELKVLGLLWDIGEDVLTINIKDTLFTSDLSRVTKREALKTLASIYDPCGIASPIILPVKLFLQELWKKNYKWDAIISEELIKKWEAIIPDLQTRIREIRVPRYVETNLKGAVEYELHCFTDASKDSYAAVVYLRISNKRDVKTALLMAKSRVVPLERNKTCKKTQEENAKKKKLLTIPQLELLGCVIGNRLLSYLKDHLELSIAKQYLWTDSLIVLSWIHSDKLLPPFVGNRIKEIKQNTVVEAYYVNSKENPADIATRPELWPQKKQVWMNGPKFLSRDKRTWPADIHLRNHQVQSLASIEAEGLEEQHPDYVTQQEPDNNTVPAPKQPHTNSQVQIIRNLQETHFPEEIRGKETNLTRNLGLFTDVDGLLRCTGRMIHTDWSYDMKHPILLPRDCEFTRNVIKDSHERNYHVGAPHTLSLVRQQYWIPKGRSVVEKVLRRCPRCVKHGGGPYPLPATPALPRERVNYSTPFTYTGLDYLGPVYVDTAKEQQKRWICLFTCLAVRAIHLEVVQNLTADECILALRRLVSSRGMPTTIISDNALYFKLSAEVLKDEYCVKNRITWKFIAQLAPWQGGFYERLVGVVKHCMKRTLEKRLLNDTQLSTIIKEVETVVNSRPLTRVGTEVELVLRPADFLSLGKCLNLEMSDDCDTEQINSLTKKNLLEGWKRGQNMLHHFKSMFVNQYLMSLRERYQHSPKQPRVKSHKAPSIGDLVQIKGESKNRDTWKVGKIVNLIRGSDGQIRVAQVQVGDSVLTRSVGHLYPLELDEHESASGRNSDTDPVNESLPDLAVYRSRLIPISQPSEEPKLDNQKTDQNTEPCHQSVEKVVSVDDKNMDSEASQLVAPMDVEEIESDSLPACEETSGTGSIQENGETSTPGTERRAAAIRARQKIAEWTRLLAALF